MAWTRRKTTRKTTRKPKRTYRRKTAYKPRTKKGRTGGKRRADSMKRYSAPVSRGTKVTKGSRGPAGVGYNMSQVSDTCTRITGRAYLGEISTKGKLPTAGGNAIGLVFDINPALLNDRVAVIASTFEKYVYHGVKFTYVPQCATSVSGSVGMVFDRDPLQYAACVNNGQFLAEVMSYEHAVLTPGYVGASTAYTRDPKELKTWFVSAPDATLSTRETSQGNFIAYVSNGEAEKGYGFIVMDYVLDLVAPNLLPNKQRVDDSKSAPSQWRDFSGITANLTFTPQTSFQQPVGTNTVAYPMWGITAGLYSDIGAEYLKAGAVGEFIFGGKNSSNAYLAAPANFVGSDNATVTLKHGQKLYFTYHQASPGTGIDYGVLSFHTTLSSARAAAGTAFISTTAAIASILPDCIYAVNTDTVQIGGWLRLITDGTSGVTNNA